jgi:hypothetical protein
LALHSAADVEPRHLVERQVCGLRTARKAHLESVGREGHDGAGASALTRMGKSHAGSRREGLRGNQLREREHTNEENCDLSTHGITLWKEVMRISRYARPSSIGHRT